MTDCAKQATESALAEWTWGREMPMKVSACGLGINLLNLIAAEYPQLMLLKLRISLILKMGMESLM